jgi:hypothetical protein
MYPAEEAVLRQLFAARPVSAVRLVIRVTLVVAANILLISPCAWFRE